MGMLFNKKKPTEKESKESTPKYTGKENQDIFKSDPKNGIDDVKNLNKRIGKFDPAIFYEKLPKRYADHIEYVGAISTYIIIEGSLPNEDVNRVMEGTARSRTKQLEIKVRENLKTSGGDLALLQKPVASIVGKKPTEEKPNNIECMIEVSGDLYKTTGVETVFEN
jgi:hypothetical protein